jgi:hypothetical protein
MSTNSKKLLNIALAVLVVGLLALPGCGFAKEKTKEAAEQAGDLVDKAAEAAGEVTANWLGTTAANVGKNYNKSVIERLKYLEISIDKISYETKNKKKVYTIELTINNTAPDNEKIYSDILIDDNYLVACDQDDYTYNLLLYKTGDEESEDDYYDDYYDDTINAGKNHLTVYTELNESDEIDHLLFIDKSISAESEK